MIKIMGDREKKNSKKKKKYGVKRTGVSLASSLISMAARWTAVILLKSCKLVLLALARIRHIPASGFLSPFSLALRSCFLHWLLFITRVVIVGLRSFSDYLIRIGLEPFSSHAA
jgi:hypothetical protein